MGRTLRVTIIGAIVLLVAAFGYSTTGDSAGTSTPSVKAQNVQAVHQSPDAIWGISADELKASNVQRYQEVVTAVAVQNYVQAVAVSDILRYVAAVDAQAAHDAAAARQVPIQGSSPPPADSTTPTGGGCAAGGGDLSGASAFVVARESGGNYCAKNPGSSACGAYQILDSTWNGFGGYSSACQAPPAVQDAKAKSMDPCNWQPPNYCAG